MYPVMYIRHVELPCTDDVTWLTAYVHNGFMAKGNSSKHTFRKKAQKLAALSLLQTCNVDVFILSSSEVTQRT